MSDMESLNKQEIGFLKEQFNRLEKKIDGITAQLEVLIDGYVKRDELNSYVTKEAFAPVKTICYGAVGIILTSVLGALVYLVVQK